jgi:RHS repeat-associated protein
MQRLTCAFVTTLALSLAAPAARAGGADLTRISLPTGPASIEGLGKSFSATLSSGTASYTIDIPAPPAAGGFGPKLALAYEGGGGVAALGMGWALGGPVTIRRRTDDGLPSFGAGDGFQLEGLGAPCELVEVSPGVFRPLEERGAFVRAMRGSSGDTWEVRDKSGVTHRLGGAGWLEAEGGKVASYLLREQVDLHGHVIAYEWDASSGHGLLKKVVWNDFGPEVRSSIELSYEPRPDPIVRYSAGIRQVIEQRLAGVVVRHGGAQVRRYALEYASIEAHSVLKGVVATGSDDATAMPPLAFEYTEASYAADGQVVGMTTPPGHGLADPDAELCDLNGDGLPDLLLAKAGAYRSYVNQDGKAWLSGEDWQASDSPSVSLSAPGVHMADLDGDGALDLVAKSGLADYRFFPGSSATSFGSKVQLPTVPNVDLDHPDVQLADMDGDRRVDAVISASTGWAVAYNLGGTDFAAPVKLGAIDLKQVLHFADGHTSLCDVNGDRVQDVCYLLSGSLAFWLGRGRGVFEPAATGSGVPAFEASSPWELRDLNGDGWVDLVHVGVGQVRFVLAEAPGKFGPERTIGGVPPKLSSTVVRFADMNASGTTDVVWVDVKGSPNAAWRYLELFPSGRGGLLRKIESGLGGVTTITYGTAAADAAAARAAGKPWGTRINIALPVVKAIQFDSGLSDPAETTRYVYHDGSYDIPGRTFAGFGGGEEINDGDSSTPTLVTRSRFDTGLLHRVLRGAVLSVETRDEQGKVFARVENQHQVVAVAKGLDGRPIEYAYRSSESKQVVEGTDLASARRTLTEWEQDSWGNVIVQREFGEVLGGDPLAGGDERITFTTYAQDPVEWVLGRLATREVQDASGKRLSLTRIRYDGPSFVGLPLGKVSRGDVTRVEQWVGPGPEQFVVQTANAYDADGNVTESRDAAGGARRFAWDPVDRTSLVGETLVLGTRELVATTKVHRAFGKPLSVSGFDGQMTKFAYDALGRLTAIARPGDSLDAPTLAFEYVLGAPLSRIVTRARIWNGKHDVEVHESLIDARGRSRGRMLRDDADRWVLDGVRLLDARGNERREVLPRFVEQAEHDLPPLLDEAPGTDQKRDATGRVTERRLPSGISSRTTYTPFGKQTWDGAANDPSSPYEHTPAVETTDGLGRLVSIAHTLEGKVLSEAYEYDAADNLLSKTDPEGNVSRFAYDGRGLRTAIDDPDAGKHALAYDDAGNLVEHHRPDGSVGRDVYDPLGRKLSEDWDGDGKPEVELVYDVHPDHPNDSSTRGRLVITRDASGSTTRRYDQRGNVVRLFQVVEGEHFETETRYDAQDRLYLQGYPDGSSLRVQRNARGRVSGYGRAVEIALDADGQETRRTFNTGVVQLFGYDADRLPRASRVKAPDGRVVQDLEWARDAAGNVLQVKDKRASVGPDTDRSETYVYDNLYRLRSASGTWGETSFSYSPSGNLIHKKSTLPAENAGELGYGKAAGPHAMTSYRGRALSYDPAGRLTGDGVRKYQWDALSNLSAVETQHASVQSTFGQNHERRVKIERDANGLEHRTYFLSPWSEVRDGELVRFIVHGGERIARLDAGTGRSKALGPMPEDAPPISPWPFALFVLLPLVDTLRRERRLARVPALAAVALVGCGAGDPAGSDAPAEGTVLTLGPADALLFHDGLGSLTEVVRATGERLASAAVYPYGRTRYDDANETHKYTGVPRDSSVEVDHMQARWYVPELGVWSSVDPLNWLEPTKKVGLGFAAGNPYAYAGGQPTSATDRNGECPWCLIVLAGAASGFAANSEYDRQVKTGESNVYKMIAASVIAGEATVLGARLPTPSTGALGSEMFWGGARTAASGMAGQGLTSYYTGSKLDPSYVGKTAAFDFFGGALGAMTAKAGADAVSYGMQDEKFAIDVATPMLEQPLAMVKAIALPEPPQPGRRGTSSSPRPRSASPAPGPKQSLWGVQMFTTSVSKGVQGDMGTSQFQENLVKEVQSQASYR